MTQHQVCILGGTGFVGRHLAARLSSLKVYCKILTRRREAYRELLVLPNCDVIETDVYQQDNLYRAFQGCTTVINLVGILNESGHDGAGFRQAHVDLTRLMLQAAQQAGVQQILHMSALHADGAKGGSFYLRTKGEAEDYLHTFHGAIHVTSFRPSVIFGPGDSFFNRFAGLLKIVPYIFPLACADARFAPVYVGDVVEQFVRALVRQQAGQARIDLCGPQVYTLRELVAFTAKTLGLRRNIIGLPNFVAMTQALLMEYFVPTRPFSLDNYYSLQVDSICRNGAKMPTSIHTVVPGYLRQQNLRQYYQHYRRQARR